MTKWEYLVLSPYHEEGDRNILTNEFNPPVFGYKLNDKIIIFEVRDDRNLPDRHDANYQKYASNGQNQILNELGDEGWELIKIRGASSRFPPTYFFKRPL